MKLAGLSFVVLGLAFHPALAAGSDDAGLKDLDPSIQIAIAPLLKDQSIVPLALAPGFVWKIDDYNDIPLPPEKIEHTNGIFGVVESHAVHFQNSPLQAGFFSDSILRVLKPGIATFNQEQAQTVAVGFMQKHFGWFFERSQKPVLTAKPVTFGGLANFEWQQYGDDEMPTARLSCTVRVMDGRITSFAASEFKGEWKHDIKPSQAIRLLKEEAGKNRDIKEIEVTGWNVSGGGGRRNYVIGLKGRRASDNRVVLTSGQVDAMTGAIGRAVEGWTISHEVETSIEDRLPTWTKNGLAFVSNRRISDLPSWVRPQSQVMVRNRNGQISYVTCDLSYRPQALIGLPNSAWAIMERRGGTYGFDLGNGGYRALDQTRRSSFSTSFDSTGRWAVECGSIAHSIEDLHFYSNDLRSPRLNLLKRISLPGRPYKTMFSPDGKRIYFVSQQFTKKGEIHSLGFVVLADLLKKTTSGKVEQRILTNALPSEVLRLSAFGNSSRLLLQTTRGMVAVHTTDGKVTPLSLGLLKDRELAGATVSRIQDGWAGPGDDHITFSGEVMALDKKKRRRIYSCRFDGSDLKALTPQQDVPIKAYDFPDASVTPYSLTRSWVLEELVADRAKALGSDSIAELFA